MRNPRRVLSKAQILDRVWNYDFGGQANVVELYISYLRKKIDAGRPPMIHTMRGAGYVLKPAQEPASPRTPAEMRTPRTLTARLVVTAVVLVAVVSLLIAAVTTLAIRTQLLDQLDENVLVLGAPRRPDGDRRRRRRPTGRRPPTAGNQGPGTLIARSPTARPATRIGRRADRASAAASASCPAPTCAQLDEVPADGDVHGVDLTALGSYRVAAVEAADGDRLVSGLPTRDVDETVASLVGYEVAADPARRLLAAGGPRHGRRTPPAAAAARGRRDRAPRRRHAARLGRRSTSTSGCPSGSPTSAPRSARWAPR